MSTTLPQFWRRPLVGNALSLYAVQGLNYLVPLLLVPYVLRVLGPRSYGSIVFSQALMGYALVITDYGFNLTAARDISVVRNDPAAVARIYWATMTAKLLLCAASLAVIGVLVTVTPALRQSWSVTACCSVLVLGSIAFPQWYFQGLERLRETALMQALAKIVTAVAVVALVRSPHDLLAAAFILSAPQAAGVVAAKCLGRSLAPALFVRPSARDIHRSLHGAWHVFAGSASVALYGHTNTFVLGMLCGEQAVAVYNVGFRLVSALQSLVTPVIQAIYPRTCLLFARDPGQAWALVIRVAWLLMPLIIAAALLLAIYAPTIVGVVGGGAYAAAVPVTRILCIMPAGITAAMLLAQCVMLNSGMTKALMRIYLTVGLVNLAVLPLMIWKFAAPGAAMSLVLAELLGPALMLRVIVGRRA